MPQREPDRQMMSPITQFATDVKAKRESLGISQNRLAEILEMDRSAISRIESGDRDPRLSEALAIAEALGIEPVLHVDPSSRTVATHIHLIEQSMMEARRHALRALAAVNYIRNVITIEAKAEVAREFGYPTYEEALAATISRKADQLQPGWVSDHRGDVKYLLAELSDPSGEGSCVLYFDEFDKSIKDEILRGVVGNILFSEVDVLSGPQ